MLCYLTFSALVIVLTLTIEFRYVLDYYLIKRPLLDLSKPRQRGYCALAKNRQLFTDPYSKTDGKLSRLMIARSTLTLIAARQITTFTVFQWRYYLGIRIALISDRSRCSPVEMTLSCNQNQGRQVDVLTAPNRHAMATLACPSQPTRACSD